MGGGDPVAVRWIRRLWLREWLLMSPTMVWLAIDRTPWSWDPAWYGEVATDLWWTLAHQPDAWGGQMLAAFGIKAPAIAWLAQFFVPLGHAVGAVDDALMLVPVLAALVTVRLWFQIGDEMWGGDARGGWVLALLGAGAPLFVGLTHQFFVEPLQLLGVTALWWLALAAPQWPRLRLVAVGALTGVFLLATKVTSPAFAFVPMLLLGWRGGKSRAPWLAPTRGGRVGDVLLLIALAVVGSATCAWYVRNLPAMRDWVVFAAQDESSLIYGRHPEWAAKWGFWLGALHREFFTLLTGSALLPLAVLVAIRLRHVRHDRFTTILAWAGGTQVLIVLWGFSRQIPEISRYSLPLLTSALLPVVWLLAPLTTRRNLALGALVLAAAQWLGSHAMALNALSPGPRPSEWLARPDPDPSYAAELDAVIASTTTSATAFRYFVNGYELPWLNANTLSYHAAKGRLATGIRAYYTSLGYGAKDAAAAWRRIEEMQAEGFISLAPQVQAPEPSFMNQVARPVLARVDQGPEFAREHFPNRHDIVLYRRTSKRH